MFLKIFLLAPALPVLLFCIGCNSFKKSTIEVVDTHVHVFDIHREDGIPWPPKDDSTLFRESMPENFIPVAKANGVRKVVVVQAGDRLTDNQWNLDITKKHEELFVGVVGNMPIIGTPEFRPMLIRLAKDPRYLGFRISGRPKNRKLFSGSIWEDLQLTSDLGLTLDLLMNNHTANIGFDEVETIAKKYPYLKIVMNHVGGYPIDGENVEPNWSKRFEEIARNENVFCKVSALLERSVIRPYSFEPADYRSVLDFLLEIFGEDRLIYGSDWPVTKRSGLYAKHKALVTHYFTKKGQETLKKVMYENARKVYSLN